MYKQHALIRTNIFGVGIIESWIKEKKSWDQTDKSIQNIPIP